MKSSISQSWYWIGLAVPFAANRKSIIRQQEKNIAFSAPCVCDRHAERLNVRIFAIYRCNGIAIICFVNLSVIFVFGPFWWQTQWFADSAHDFRLATDTLLVDRMLPFASSNDSIESLDTESTDYDDDEKPIHKLCLNIADDFDRMDYNQWRICASRLETLRGFNNTLTHTHTSTYICSSMVSHLHART